MKLLDQLDDLGFRVVVVADCTAAQSAREQQASESLVFPLLGEMLWSGEFLALLRHSAAVA